MIAIIGTGPGDGRYALPIALEKIRGCSCLSGYGEHLSRYSQAGQQILDLSSRGLGLEEGLSRIGALEKEGKSEIGVVVSGDPGFHSLLSTITRRFPQWDLEVIPGLSAFQVACAKLALPWQEMTLLSLHGGESPERTAELARLSERLKPLEQGSTEPRGAVVLTGGFYTPEKIAAGFVDQCAQWGGLEVWLCCNIGENDELLRLVTLRELAEKGARERQSADGGLPGKGLCTMIFPPRQEKSI
jgi:cobalt-precorrin-7 (C5)-methyltransferase